MHLIGTASVASATIALLGSVLLFGVGLGALTSDKNGIARHIYGPIFMAGGLFGAFSLPIFFLSGG